MYVVLFMAQFSIVWCWAPFTYAAYYSVNCDAAVTGKYDPKSGCVQAPSGAVKKLVLVTSFTSGQAASIQPAPWAADSSCQPGILLR